MRRKYRKQKKIWSIFVWPISIVIAFGTMWLLFGAPRNVFATVLNSGVAFFGDHSATSQGVLRVRTFSDPNTYGAQFNGATASGTQFINWTTAKAAPTREEMMIGMLKYNGTLDIQTCTTGCDANADFTAQWNNPGTNATLTCNTTTAFGCVRPFDITYESLSGKGFVAYADNVAAKIYYARWDGSAWSPNSTPGTPGGTNELNINPGGGGAACSGTPKWIRAVSAGENLDQDRSNRIMVIVGDTNHDICAFYWDGSSFDTGKTVTINDNNCDVAICFDGAWQDNTNFILAHSDGAASGAVYYSKYTVGTGWGSDAQAFTTVGATYYVHAVSDPTSTRVMVTTVASVADDVTAGVWRGDNATDGWTLCASGSCPDAAIEDSGGMQGVSAFERFNGDGLLIYNDNSTTADPSYMTYAQPSTWGTTTRNSITTTDDALMVKAWGSPNSDHIVSIVEDVDCKIYGNTWTGSGWDATATNINNGTTATVSNYLTAAVTTCPNALTPAAQPTGIAYAYDFAFKLYAAWQRNWRFYSGTDTASVPTSALAAENTTPTSFDGAAGKFRLRINYSERGTMSSTDSRRKLQYTSGCNPNSTLETDCTWTDVDNAGGGGIWRYFDPTCTATDCADNSLLTGTVLTGTDASCTLGNGCGVWTLNNNGATVTNMDHNGTKVQEGEWIVEANSAASSTTYYFRVYDAQQLSPVYREQDASDCGGGAAACTYPSLTTAAPTGPTTDQVMRHGNWFNSGTEQGFYWAN